MALNQVYVNFIFWICTLCPVFTISILPAQDTYTSINEQVFTGDALNTEILTKALFRHFPILRQTTSQLQLIQQIESPGGYHYTFAQHLDGIRIYGGMIKANLNKSGKLVSCMNNLKSSSRSNNYTFALDEAYFISKLSSDWPDARMTIEPNLKVEENKLRPIYRVLIHDAFTGLNEERLYDANSGSILNQVDINSYFSLTDTSGKGRVFIPNPSTKSQMAYGGELIDNEDAHTSFLEALMDTVVLKDLTFDGTFFRLDGPYVKVEDITMPDISPVTSRDGDFFFGRNESGFEDVMVYYHIDQFQRYIQGLGFTNLQNRPFRVDAHASESDNSNFVTNFGDSYIRFGKGGVDDAEDADVIIHEYIHALSYAATGLVMSGFERKAIDEGLGDYFAAGYSKDINPFEWNKVFNWDGHNEFWLGRDAATMNTYPPEKRDIYAYGEVWASSLMRIRDEIGADVTDRIVLQEMYSNINDMSFEDAGMLLLEADSLLYNGIHTDIITFYTCQSNVRPQAFCLSVGIKNDYTKEGILIYPNPSKGNFSINYPADKSFEFHLYNLLGQKVHTKGLPLGGKAELDLVLPRGTYVYQLVNPILGLKMGKLLIE